jgi:hypothetical protein
MAINFVVEQGQAGSDSTSYASIEFIDQYHTDQGNELWLNIPAGAITGLTALQVKQVCANKASSYMDKRFSRRWLGVRRSRTQKLKWPRLDAFDIDGFFLSSTNELPPELLSATAEYALRAYVYKVLAPDPIKPVPAQDFTGTTYTAQDLNTPLGPLRTRSVRVGPVADAKGYLLPSEASKGGSRTVQSFVNNDYNIPEYPEADMYLERLLRPPMNAALLSRGD